MLWPNDILDENENTTLCLFLSPTRLFNLFFDWIIVLAVIGINLLIIDDFQRLCSAASVDLIEKKFLQKLLIFFMKNSLGRLKTYDPIRENGCIDHSIHN